MSLRTAAARELSSSVTCAPTPSATTTLNVCCTPTFSFEVIHLNRYCKIVFYVEEDPQNKSFFSEIISSISDLKFSKDGRYMVSRDYLTLKIWDVNMESQPLQTIHIHDQLRGKLCDLYENDCIFDKFECNFNGAGTWALLYVFASIKKCSKVLH